MRTVRGSGRRGEGGLPGGVCLGGVCPGGVCPGVSAHWGVSAQGAGVSAWGVSAPMHAGIHTPTVNRMTDACKNITLPQLRCGW